VSFSFRDHRIEFAIVQVSSKSTTFPQTSTTTASCAQPGPLPTSRPSSQRKQSGSPAAGPQVSVSTPAMDQVVVPDPWRVRDVVQNLDRAIQLQMTQEGHSNLCLTGRTHDQPRS